MANPAFVIVSVFVPIGALIYALNFGSIVALNYVHIMTGAMWTGIDLFMGFVIGPVLRLVSLNTRRAMIAGIIPRTLILMPTLSAITSTTGWRPCWAASARRRNIAPCWTRN